MKDSGVAIIIGTKAELIKCMPLMKEFQNRSLDYFFIHTGQHPLGKACEKFGIKKPDFILSKEPDISTKFWSKINRASFFWNIEIIFKIKKMLKKINPKYVVYHGDTMSTSSAAIGSSKFFNPGKKWKNVHLEAGLRSGSLFEPFPEEISRKICDNFSDILLAVSDLTEKTLKKEFKNKIIIKTGNTIVDSAKIVLKKNKNKKQKYALVNLHRHENLRSKERMKKIIRILGNIKIKTIWPIHDNTLYYLKKYGLLRHLKKMKNVEILPLTDYSDFIFLLANCEYLVTDGGSIQEESLVFKKPCIILRKKTERQEGLYTGINFLVGVNVRYGRKIIEKIENKEIEIKNFKNPYGHEGLTKAIVEVLR